MSQFWNPLVHDLVPYVPGEQPKVSNLIKLNTNESPYGPSPRALAAIQAALDDKLRLYPDPNSDALKQAIADFHHSAQLTPDQVFVGNGSDEVLAHVFLGLLKHPGRPLLFPDITYSFYPVYCQLYGISYQTVPLQASFKLVLADYAAISPACGVIFPNPNAPTGRALAGEEIAALAAQQPDRLVVVDEAYVDYGATSAASLVNQYPNLLVIHTLSKSRALAGLRVGYALGQRHLIEGLERVKNSFNSYPLGRLAQAGAIAAMQDRDYLNQTCQAVITTRERTVAALSQLGFEIIPSAANFIFIHHPQHAAATLAQKLRERHIIVRHFKQQRIEQYLRVTIGTEAQMASFISEIENILAG
ncbi:histidinol-phosphate transaminase [Parvibium lacunae]|uniref:Histidinol-phosphate aminotransferase n=1 Tax=Parvibium lacunae TaxID=1888893 RepID=A0A368L4R5_9BURK|nr:histidinol-phosphate transaminase [Parvibium lacunae]RCS58578.1 histidinol-phosphate transaminase [Parvibium lacunae]